VLLDISDSSFGKRMDDARAAVDKFLFELLDASDEFFVMAFNHRPRAITGLDAPSRGDVRHALAALRPSGGTAIYDAILEALPIVETRTRQRAAILVISDGADTASTATLRRGAAGAAPQRRLRLRHRHRLARAPANQHPGQRRGAARDNGGRAAADRDRAELGASSTRRRRGSPSELNSQYVLGYTPPRGADGQFHSLRVRVIGSERPRPCPQRLRRHAGAQAQLSLTRSN